MITNPDDYFTKGCGRCRRFDTSDCSTRLWSAGLLRLRAICREAGLDETLRWGQPCYRHADRNVAIIGAFRSTFRLTFFHAALMKDGADLLVPQGPNSPVANAIFFRSEDEVAHLAASIRAYLQEAKALAASGAKPPRKARKLDLPAEIAEALSADPELAAAFEALTPGRQRSHAIFVGGAKKAETRRARIARMRSRIMAGKGANEY